MNKEHPICCKVHQGSELELRKNPKGGMFDACPLFQSEGCRVTYSRTERRWYGDKEVVARASKLRGRATSRLRLAYARFEAETGMSRAEVKHLSLAEIEALVAV